MRAGAAQAFGVSTKELTRFTAIDSSVDEPFGTMPDDTLCTYATGAFAAGVGILLKRNPFMQPYQYTPFITPSVLRKQTSKTC